MNTLESSTNIM